MKKIFFAMMMFVSFQIFAESAYLRSAEASSVLSEWLSGKEVVYDALNAFDNKKDTVWVEDEYDSGIGSKLTVAFYEPIKIDEIRIVNGFAHKDYYKKNNRVKTLSVACINVDDGTEADYTLKDNCEDFQSIYLDKETEVTALVFTIQDVYRGTKYNDTCIDEIRFCNNGNIIWTENAEILKLAKKEAEAKASKNSDSDSVLYQKLAKRAQRYYQSNVGKLNGEAFLVPLNSGDKKGYAIRIGDGCVSFFDCWFRTVENFKKENAEYEHLWTWKENPEINIYDYTYVVDILYRYYDCRKFSFDSNRNCIITEEKLTGVRSDSISGSYEIRDYLVDVNSTYEPYSSAVKEPNYRIDINGKQYLLVDPESLFMNVYDGI